MPQLLTIDTGILKIEASFIYVYVYNNKHKNTS